MTGIAGGAPRVRGVLLSHVLPRCLLRCVFRCVALLVLCHCCALGCCAVLAGAVLLCPVTGFVQTVKANIAARHMGLAEAPVKLADSVAWIVELMDAANREQQGGKFLNLAEGGKELPW